MQSFRLLLVALVAAPISVFAQVPDARYEIGAGLGGMVYQGDLTPSPMGSYRTLRPHLNLWAGRRFSENFSVRAQLLLGSLHGDDARYSTPAWRQQRALRFTTAVTELSVLGVWDIDGGRRRLSPYLFAGVGAALVNVQRDATSFNYTFFAGDKSLTDGLLNDMTRTPPRFIPVLPLGGGLRYSLSERISVYAETGYRLSHTDYLDGFSQAGNPERFDHYQTWTLGVIYSFSGGGGGGGGSSRYGCPVLRQ